MPTFSWSEDEKESLLFKVEIQADDEWAATEVLATFCGAGRELLAPCAEYLKQQGWGWTPAYGPGWTPRDAHGEAMLDTAEPRG